MADAERETLLEAAEAVAQAYSEATFTLRAREIVARVGDTGPYAATYHVAVSQNDGMDVFVGAL